MFGGGNGLEVHEGNVQTQDCAEDLVFFEKLCLIFLRLNFNLSRYYTQINKLLSVYRTHAGILYVVARVSDVVSSVEFAEQENGNHVDRDCVENKNISTPTSNHVKVGLWNFEF